jgi:Family of unknown function (DUF6081)
MKWTVYDAFDPQSEWPDNRWVKADLGGGEVWDRTAITSNDDRGFAISIPHFTLFRPPSHGKALMLSTKAFEIANDAMVGSRCEMAVEIFGTDPNPFNIEPGDPRLASGAMVTLDLATGIVLDFLVTNDRICAVYERLAHAQISLGPYPAFTELFPTGIKTAPGQWHRFEIHYDRAFDRARWFIDGKLVAEHTPVGAPVGALTPVVKLKSLRIGGALFTLMDGGVPREDQWTWATQALPSLLKSPADELFGQGGKVTFKNYQFGCDFP